MNCRQCGSFWYYFHPDCKRCGYQHEATMAKKIEPPFLRTENNYDRNQASQETALICPEPTLTKQEFVEESDINYIADRYGLTGELPQVLDLPRYGDFTGIFDFQGAQNAVVLAKQQFMTLPAKLRARFENDPQRLMAFLDNPDNREEAEFLGLVTKPVQDEPQSVQTAPAGPTKGDSPPPDGKPAGDPSPKPSKKDKTDT